jgi:hypothetical protein
VTNLSFGNKYSNDSNKSIGNLTIDNMKLTWKGDYNSVGVCLNVELSSSIYRMFANFYFLFVLLNLFFLFFFFFFFRLVKLVKKEKEGVSFFIYYFFYYDLFYLLLNYLLHYMIKG